MQRKIAIIIANMVFAELRLPSAGGAVWVHATPMCCGHVAKGQEDQPPSLTMPGKHAALAGHCSWWPFNRDKLGLLTLRNYLFVVFPLGRGKWECNLCHYN